MSSRVLGCEGNLYFERWTPRTHPPMWEIKAKMVKLLTNHALSSCVDLRERTKTMRSHGARRGQIAVFRDSFERIKRLYLLAFFKCGIKTRTHFEWVLWHWSSLCQLNLEVPTDIEKICVKKNPCTWVFIIKLHCCLININLLWNVFNVTDNRSYAW